MTYVLNAKCIFSLSRPLCLWDICTVKSTDDLVLLYKEEMILKGMTNRLTEVRRCYGMEMNAEKTKLM